MMISNRKKPFGLQGLNSLKFLLTKARFSSYLCTTVTQTAFVIMLLTPNSVLGAVAKYQFSVGLPSRRMDQHHNNTVWHHASTDNRPKLTDQTR